VDVRVDGSGILSNKLAVLLWVNKIYQQHRIEHLSDVSTNVNYTRVPVAELKKRTRSLGLLLPVTSNY